jgi:hypothetical protein
MSMKKRIFAALGLLVVAATTCAQTSTLPVNGYAKTSVNAVVFRGSSVTTFGNTQYVAWYDGSGKVVLAKRTLGSTTWQSSTTQYSGNVADAHNCISIGVDGDGVVHMAWDMHSTKLRYARGTAPGALTMGSETNNLAGGALTSATYPQFFRLPNGNLLFMVRDGSSGNGNLMLYRWDIKSKAWTRLFTSLIDGQGARNAYWEAHLDRNGVLHVGWVWRETADVATNHDICYARSRDGGVTWENSKGAKYATPITAATAEYAATIPQKSELINQTSIHGDDKSRPYIASYWVPQGGTVPQYQLVWNDGSTWKTSVISRRTIDFSLSGVGTKKIPISRPQVVVDGRGDSIAVYMVYRDTQETSKVSLYQTANLAKGVWSSANLTSYTVDSWEPSYDADLWASSHLLHIYVQRAGQGDGETSVNLDPQPVTILEWKPPTLPVGVGDKTVPVAPDAGPGHDALGRLLAPREPGFSPEVLLGR